MKEDGGPPAIQRIANPLNACFVFLARRDAVPALFIIIALAFFLRPRRAGSSILSARSIPSIAENLRRIYKLDLPLIEQFWLYLQSSPMAISGRACIGAIFRSTSFCKGCPSGQHWRTSHADRDPAEPRWLAGTMSKSAIGRALSMARRYSESFCRSLSSRRFCSSIWSTLHALPVGG